MSDSTTVYSRSPLLTLKEDEDQTFREKEILNSNRNEIRKDENDKRIIKDLVQNSNDILMSISSVFPFDIFPKTINIEATRITIIDRQLFSSQVHSIDIEDIASVFIETSIVFASISLISKTYAQKKLVIDRLWKSEAILLRRVIEGLRMFEKSEINISNFTKKDLLEKLEELSTTKIVL